MYDSEFAYYLGQVSCSEVIVMMQQCYSGGFIQDIFNSSPVSADLQIYTAAGTGNSYINGLAYTELWLTNGLYDEFTFYWCAAVRGYYPDFEYPWTTNIVTGQFPFENVPGLGDHHDGDHYPDLNADGYISMEEAYDYARHMDTWVEYGENYQYVPLETPEVPMEDAEECAKCQTMTGYAGHIALEQLHGCGWESSVFRISGNLTVDNYLEFRYGQTGIYLATADAQINTNTLITCDEVTFIGTNAANQIRISNSLQLGNDNIFTSDGPSWDVYLNGIEMQTNINQATFNKCRLHNYGDALTITHSTFDDCQYTFSHKGEVSITDTDFDRTWLYLENTEVNLNTVSVTNCSFTTDITMAAIDLWNYNQYNITNNTIHGYYNGIQMFQSGYGELKKAMISDNNITNCTHRGILAYNSRGAFYRNHIYDNCYGVWLADHSSVQLFGNYNASTNAETQEIRDNHSYEVYASQYSFPPYFRYNVIIDDDNLGAPGDPLVFHSGGNFTIHDVKYNCWEDIPGSFVAAEDLYPGGYFWQPTWCPGDNKNNTPDPDEDMYEIAGNLFESEDYAGAKTMYQTLIDQYPQSKYAKAAMQELFALEKFVSNDYSALKQYYATSATIQSDTALFESAAFLSSKCDVKTENWPGAINYYENIILAPETMEDSIFAIINLGYVYFVMENSGYKSAHTGNLAQYKPETKEQFFEDRDYLLSLLPDDKTKNPMQENLAKLNEGELLQNVPNPFNGTTQIGYKLENESTVHLNIYNYTGQLISQINEGTQTKGTHQISFNATGLTNGIYFYSISVNGQTTDARKMTVIK
jgi:hypothetical protein